MGGSGHQPAQPQPGELAPLLFKDGTGCVWTLPGGERFCGRRQESVSQADSLWRLLNPLAQGHTCLTVNTATCSPASQSARLCVAQAVRCPTLVPTPQAWRVAGGL
ncbi:AT-rich interactive domain-containing protein 3A-like [Platysternon megacephalum]|uniref:AT-rich interactive domain-containing protein 3A-like n=1 Tax=Platysternon megacephalum TaxID=55544 RepID=A0A4D9DXU1_9SAUR|nr:AT-rich interactive domain-containing protein 3A-like [Platysternon megacephalum]